MKPLLFLGSLIVLTANAQSLPGEAAVKCSAIFPNWKYRCEITDGKSCESTMVGITGQKTGATFRLGIDGQGARIVEVSLWQGTTSDKEPQGKATVPSKNSVFVSPESATKTVMPNGDTIEVSCQSSTSKS